MKSLFPLAFLLTCSAGGVPSDGERQPQERRMVMAPSKCLLPYIPTVEEDAEKPLLYPEEMPEGSGEAALYERLKIADVIILVCYFETVYVPSKDPATGKCFPLWIKRTRGRVVQSLRGDIPVGSLFEVRDGDERTPPGIVYTMEAMVRGGGQGSDAPGTGGTALFLGQEKRDPPYGGGICV